MKPIKLGRASWFDLADKEQAETAREATRGRAGVYLLRQVGAAQVEYIGSAFVGETGAKRGPLAFWKTIKRHLHACRFRNRYGKKRRGNYDFQSDNFCAQDAAKEYEVAIMITAPADARRYEQAAINKYRPHYNAQNLDRMAEVVPF